jgi:hypothetical protein
VDYLLSNVLANSAHIWWNSEQLNPARGQTSNGLSGHLLMELQIPVHEKGRVLYNYFPLTLTIKP